MCDKCEKLDKKIELYETIVVSIGDRATVERFMAMILQAQKAALHPEQKQWAALAASFVCWTAFGGSQHGPTLGFRSFPLRVATFCQARIVCQLSAIVTGLRLGRVPWKGIIANGPFRNLIPLVAANQPS